ncbi:hypothetical protein TEA_017225 [Camellia sinensis var. sinensis]|uniref:Uncharacterized protein n=1 Tax=Camellia sinensis var. sinensis TaxID=542762 RepID=A0A4S4DNS6_CAMSN|nr:hypothetical protein TEA_017225 [Camellia sinensis var. sinensis]
MCLNCGKYGLQLHRFIKRSCPNLQMGTEKLEGIVMKYPDLENRDPKDFGFPEELKCVGIAIAVVAIGVENVLDFLWFDMRHKTVRVLNPQIEWDTDFTCIKSKNVEVIYVTRGNVLFDSAVENLNEGEEFKVEWDFCEEIEVEWNSRETVVQKCGVRWVCKEDFERNDHQASQDDNLIVVSQGVENANNAPLKRRPSGSGDFQEEDCPNIKRPRLAQPNRVEQVGAWKKRKSPKRKKMKVTWITSTSSHIKEFNSLITKAAHIPADPPNRKNYNLKVGKHSRQRHHRKGDTHLTTGLDNNKFEHKISQESP